MLLARRLLSTAAPDRERQRLRALRLAAREFNLSLTHHTPQPQPAYLQVCLFGALWQCAPPSRDPRITGCLC
jgi:hypothetical protein